MSKFIDSLVSKDTGKLNYPQGRLQFKIDEIPEFTYMMDNPQSEYRFEVNWGVMVRCYPKDLAKITENVLHQLKRDVYGEFYDKILSLERAMYEANEEKMLEYLRDLKKIIME